MRKGRPKVALILTTEERQRLESLAHRSRSAAAVARRARIILACAEGRDSKVDDEPPKAAAMAMPVPRPTTSINAVSTTPVKKAQSERSHLAPSFIG